MATTDYSISSLPANVDAERSILGAILLDNFSYNQAAEHLRADDFSLDSHRRIYSRMIDLAESSRPIDMITLIEELDRHKDLQSVGDVGYISRWTMEISNHTQTTILVPVGFRICQLTFEYVGETLKEYRGKYGKANHQWTPEDMLPKPYFDWDYDVYRTDRGSRV